MASGNYTSSLMFGVQWDLVLKYMETKGGNRSELKTGKSWGNFASRLWTVDNELAKYSTDLAQTWINAPYSKTSSANIVLTTGASNQFSREGIYDFAGNIWE